ncbi:MAG: helix-turn-helix domain-containing protein [Pseudonocardiaceae bacterium]
MAQKRQGLAQRRKAVGLTQEALAHQLGVERSTVVRWEAGDTEPLPSIRPDVARALRVSLDQLAELLSESENAEVLLPEVASPERPDRDELENLIRSQVAETVEVLRRTLRSAGVAPADIDALLLAGKLSQVPLIDVQQRRARSRRFAVAGVLTLVLTGGALSVPFITAHSDPIPPAAVAPAIPLPDPGSSKDNDPTVTSHPAPATAPSTPVSPVAAPVAVTVPAPHTKRTTSPAAVRTPAPPGTPAIPAEVYAWSQAAGLSARDLRSTPLRP